MTRRSPLDNTPPLTVSAESGGSGRHGSVVPGIWVLAAMALGAGVTMVQSLL